MKEERRGERRKEERNEADGPRRVFLLFSPLHFPLDRFEQSQRTSR